MGFSFGGELNASRDTTNTNSDGTQTQTGTVTTGKELSQAGVQQIINDLLSSAGGTSDILSQDNLTGASKSSTEQLQAQDFYAKVFAQLANITAKDVQTTDLTQTTHNTSSTGHNTYQTKNKFGTIICTKLTTLGYIPLHIYLTGNQATPKPSKRTYKGYIYWAEKVLPFIGSKHPWITKFFLAAAVGRYEYYLYGTKSFGAFLGLGILFPLSQVVGFVLEKTGKLDRVTEEHKNVGQFL